MWLMWITMRSRSATRALGRTTAAGRQLRGGPVQAPPRPRPYADRVDATPYRLGTRTSTGWVIGSVRGTPVVLAPSWLLIAAVLVVLFYPAVGRLLVDPVATAATTAGFVAMLFVSVFLHELAHGTTARRAGARPREYAITFWGGHTAFDRELPTPATSAWVSAAGPLTNLLIAAVVWGVTEVVDPVSAPARLLLLGALVSNVFVGAFNLLPGTPLDGGRVLEALVWAITGNRYTGVVAAAWGGRVIAGVLVAVVVGGPLLRGERVDLFTVVWAALLGGVLWSGASQALQQARVQQSVADLDLRALAVPAAVLPAAGTTADAEGPVTAGWAVLTADGGRLAGVVDLAAWRAVPPTMRAATPLSAVSRTLPPGAVITAFTGPDAVVAASRAQRAGAPAVLLDGGRVAGVVTRERLLAELDRRDPRAGRRGAST